MLSNSVETLLTNHHLCYYYYSSIPWFSCVLQVNLFVHAYVTFNSIATLYELNQSLADLGSKSDFEELRLGPLIKQPVVYNMFKAPQSLTAIPQVTTVQIIKHLNKYMSKMKGTLYLEKFLEYLCEQYHCYTPYELGVRIQSLGLAIAVMLFQTVLFKTVNT